MFTLRLDNAQAGVYTYGMSLNVTHSTEQNMSSLSLTTPAQIDAFRARVILSAIKVYLNTGMRVNRMYTVSAMGRVATEYTGMPYKATRKGLLQAYTDLGGDPAQIK